MLKLSRRSSTRIQQTADYEHCCAQSKRERVAGYLRQAEHSWQSARDLYYSSGWKVVEGKNLDTGLVTQKHDTDGKKIFKIEGSINAKPELVFEQLFYASNETPTWNPTILRCNTLDVINDRTDIVYSISSPTAGGMVSSREFVILRHWKKTDDMIISLGDSTHHPSAPVTSNYVRGENNPSAWVFKSEDRGRKCHFTMILKTDIKGCLPQCLVDKCMNGVLFSYIQHLRDRMITIQSSTDISSSNLPSTSLERKRTL